ncbi:EF-hand domain-containing protein [Lutibaculum baratangense]|uniref:EF-hand domain-containing protein n=1 Tax=Lutibaculum baratangense AMV1 TaxID=631454 RepID=V4RDA8_9HYPH|nr:EF-hand domain-containing protein [Lutibaculum baratangense]ESR24136.1 hypothetical protein N177_2585 [Lutibaculum baratangense AMV1]
MKTSIKFLALGSAMVATAAMVGGAVAQDSGSERGWRDGPRHERQYERRGDGPRWQREGRHERHHGGGHHGGGYRGGHHGMMGMGGHGMMGMGGMGGPAGKMMFMRVFQLADTDGDGRVTQEDFDAFLQDRMEQYDANGDGELQLDEYKAFFAELVEPMAVRSFQALDPDGDASLTREEFGARLDGIVEKMDRDGDGALTLQDRRGGREGWRSRRGDGQRTQAPATQDTPAEVSPQADDEDAAAQ